MDTATTEFPEQNMQIKLKSIPLYKHRSVFYLEVLVMFYYKNVHFISNITSKQGTFTQTMAKIFQCIKLFWEQIQQNINKMFHPFVRC